MLRILVVSLLALAVPLQGMATVVAGQCMTIGHHQDQADGHVHSDGHGDGTAHEEHDGGKNSHCGPCAACCASASIAGSASLPILATPANIKYGFSQLPPRGVQPHGIDRPPLAL
jgi:hypothetical protein